MRLVDNFFNSRNPSLVQTLQNEAWEEDADSSIAYYLIKDSNDNILFFFSLKNGSLYDQHLDTHTLQLLKELNQFVQESLQNSDLTDEEKGVFSSFQEKIRTQKGISKVDLDKLPKKKDKLFEDLEKELSKSVTHVGKTYSAIELVHFCSNNACDELWDGYNLPYERGVIFFWHFIVRKILEAKSILGIQYLFLFAADLSDDGRLIAYYEDLNFIRDEERATAKPIYDLTCEFMYQETKDLAERRNAFFANFNPDTEEV